MEQTSPTTIDEILEGFALRDDWEERYRYLIELGRELEPLPEIARTAANKVQGCTSQVWLDISVEERPSGGPVLRFKGDSDSHLVRGLIAILTALYSGQTATKILDIDPAAVLDGIRVLRKEGGRTGTWVRDEPANGAGA